MADAKRALVIDFKAKGSPQLIKAINKLATAQQRLEGTQKKVAKTQQLVNHRVNSNTRAVQANTTALTRAQSVIAIYRNRMLLASFAVTFATTAFVNFVRMAGKQEDSVRRLSAVFGTEGAESLDKYSSQLQRASTFGDENINIVMSQIGAFGANVEQTKALTQATMDLAAGLDLDLNTAGLLVAKTIGSTTDALTRYGVGAQGATDKSEKIANVVETVDIKFGGLAKKLSETTTGQLDQASNAFGDFGEELGRVFAPMVLKTAEALRFIVENLDAGKIRKFGVATLYVVTVYQLWTKELMILRGASFAATAIISAQNAVHAILTGTVTAQTIAYKALKIQVALTTTAMKALNFVMKKNPLILFATLAATAGAALLTFGGFLDDTTKKLTKEEEELLKAAAATKEYGDKVDKANKKLEDKLKLLKANSDIEKFAIENGIELADVNKDLFEEIQQVNNAVKDEKDLQQSIHNFYEANKQVQADRLQMIMVETELMMLNAKEGSEAYDKLKISLDEMNIAYDKMMDDLNGVDEIETKRLETIDNLKSAITDFAQHQIDTIRSTADARLEIMQEQENQELESLRNTRRFEKASDKQKKALEEEIIKRHDKQQKDERDKANKRMLLNFRVQQAISATETIISAHQGASKATGQLGFFGLSIAQAILATGYASAGLILAQKPPKMAKGGLVGGRRHSQGGTMIEAEQGEYVISRSGVESVGIETLNRINSGRGGAINISFQGNVLSKDFIEDEAIPQIKEAIRRGADIGVG